MSTPPPITELLRRAQGGDHEAESELFATVYGQLKRVAARQMRGERLDHTLQPTALVHEVWLRLMQSGELEAEDRAHFFRLSAKMMRHILTDHAKARAAGKREGNRKRVDLEEHAGMTPGQDLDLLALERALESLYEAAPRQHQVVAMHFFGGLTFEEIGDALGMAAKTAKRDWASARVWLHAQLYGWSDHTGALAQGE